MQVAHSEICIHRLVRHCGFTSRVEEVSTYFFVTYAYACVYIYTAYLLVETILKVFTQANEVRFRLTPATICTCQQDVVPAVCNDTFV
jgi:hypothetical protein